MRILALILSILLLLCCNNYRTHNVNEEDILPDSLAYEGISPSGFGGADYSSVLTRWSSEEEIINDPDIKDDSDLVRKYLVMFRVEKWCEETTFSSSSSLPY